MTKLTLFPILGGTKFIELELKSLAQGADFIAFTLENLSTKNKGLSLAIDDPNDEQFPTIHFQQIERQFFFQIFVGDKHNKLEEGWYCLVKDNYSESTDDLVTTIWEEPEGDYFQARFSDGVLISKSLLVSKSTFESFISKFLDNKDNWYENGNWLNVGVV